MSHHAKYLVLLFALLPGLAPLHARELVLGAPGRPHQALDMSQTVATEVFRQLGHSLNIKAMPLERALVEANAGSIDGDLMRTGLEVPDYPNLLPLPIPLADDDFVAFGIGERLTVRDAESLRPFRLATVRGIKALEGLNAEGMQVLFATDGDQAWRQLEAGRVDLVILTRGAACRPAELGLSNVVIQPGSLGRMQFYLHLHKRHAELLPQLEGVLKKMQKDGSLATLQAAVRKRWQSSCLGPQP